MATEQEQRAFNLHSKFGIVLKPNQPKKKVEGWRVCLTENGKTTTVPYCNDKTYAVCVEIKRSMLLMQPYLKGKLSIKPKE